MQCQNGTNIVFDEVNKLIILRINMYVHVKY